MGRMINKRPDLLDGLDIGTAKAAAVVVEPGPESMNVLGVGAAVSEGLRKGVVVDMESTAHAISSAVREAELSAGCEIHTVFASVGGNHVKGFNSHGVVALKGKDIDLEVDLGTGGQGRSHMWTCDLSAEYVRINADYRT